MATINDLELVKLIRDRFTIYKSDDMMLAHIPDELWKLSIMEIKHNPNPKPKPEIADPKSKITIFTDGGCTANGGKNPNASWSFVVFDNKELHRDSAKVVQGQYGNELPSNNRAEWTAILRSLEYIEFVGINSDVTIYTDSMLAVRTINEWYDAWVAKNIVNKKVNPVLITTTMNLYKKLSNGMSIVIKHCKAHQSEPNDKKSPEWFIWNGNDICDKMCSMLL
jgi:ribonuclease HI